MDEPISITKAEIAETLKRWYDDAWMHPEQYDKQEDGPTGNEQAKGAADTFLFFFNQLKKDQRSNTPTSQ